MDESITVERVGHALVVGRSDAAVQLAQRLPGEPDRTFVVVGDSSLDAMTRLDPWVIADLADEVTGDLCVVAPGFGSMGQDGTLPPARLLAERLGVEVTAADGHPLGLTDGTVFVPGGWVAYQPGGQRTAVGARLPAPWWQDGLPDPSDHVTHIPAGLWIRGDSSPRPADPLLRRVPDRDRMYVVLGAPGEPPPAVATVAEALRALPERHPTVLAWYGEPAGELLRAVADALGAPVRAAHGVPGDGTSRVLERLAPVRRGACVRAGWRIVAVPVDRAAADGVAGVVSAVRRLAGRRGGARADRAAGLGAAGTEVGGGTRDDRGRRGDRSSSRRALRRSDA